VKRHRTGDERKRAAGGSSSLLHHQARSEAAGLGLSTVYGIVNQSGGQILAESEPGKGSTFLLYSRCGGSTAGRTTEEEVAPWETILLVEDEENVRSPGGDPGRPRLPGAGGGRRRPGPDLEPAPQGPIHLM